MENFFYHQIIKKTVLGFALYFSKVKIGKYNSSGEIIDSEIVPIIWSSREKTFELLNNKYLKTDLTPNNKIEIKGKFPIMSIGNLNISFDPSRQRIKTQRMPVCSQVDSYMPIPYILTFDLNVRAKTQNHLFQIIEQIIPYFAPSLNLNVKLLKGISFSESIQYSMEGVSIEIPEEYDAAEAVFFDATFSFTTKLHFYRPNVTKTKISEVISDIKIEIEED